jgi:hypothetical protein
MDNDSENTTHDLKTSNTNYTEWATCNKKIQKSEITYFCQILILFIVVTASIINLSLSSEKKDLWISLLASSIGYIIPGPSINKKKV